MYSKQSAIHGDTGTGIYTVEINTTQNVTTLRIWCIFIGI